MEEAADHSQLLQACALEDQAGMARALLTYDDLDKRDAHGRTLLMAISEAGSEAMVHGLLHHKADPSLRDHAGIDALALAARRPDAAQIVALLLQHRVQPDVPDAWGDTPLFHACEAGALRTAELLLDARADPTRPNSSGRTALSVSTRHHLVNELLEQFIESNSSPTQTPCSGSLTKHVRTRRHCNGDWQSRLPPH